MKILASKIIGKKKLMLIWHNYPYNFRPVVMRWDGITWYLWWRFSLTMAPIP